MIYLTRKPKPSLGLLPPSSLGLLARLAGALRIPEMFTCCNINVIGRLVNRAKEICLSLPFQTNISLFCNDT